MIDPIAPLPSHSDATKIVFLVCKLHGARLHKELHHGCTSSTPYLTTPRRASITCFPHFNGLLALAVALLALQYPYWTRRETHPRGASPPFLRTFSRVPTRTSVLRTLTQILLVTNSRRSPGRYTRSLASFNPAVVSLLNQPLIRVDRTSSHTAGRLRSSAKATPRKASATPIHAHYYGADTRSRERNPPPIVRSERD